MKPQSPFTKILFAVAVSLALGGTALADVSIVNQHERVVQRGRKALLVSKVPLAAVSASQSAGAASKG